MPEILLAQFQYVAQLLRFDCVKKIDNFPGDILHMVKERIWLQKVSEKKKDRP